jgi:hypothetical protein
MELFQNKVRIEWMLYASKSDAHLPACPFAHLGLRSGLVNQNAIGALAIRRQCSVLRMVRDGLHFDRGSKSMNSVSSTPTR